MLTIDIKDGELFNEVTGEIHTIEGRSINLEHSLISLHKWESKWHKPFLDNLEKKKLTNAEVLDYIRCMTISANVDPNIYLFLNSDNINEINKYISDPMTATTFSNLPKTGKKEIMTAEIIYYDMISLGIPVEFEKWHLNSLLTLIKVCDVKNSPSKKMGKQDLAAHNSKLNAARRKSLGSRG